MLARLGSRSRGLMVMRPPAPLRPQHQLLLRPPSPAVKAFSKRARRRHEAEEEDMTIIDVDFGRPHEWYPAARRLKRSIICHTGPTNSGKTFEALERLRGAANGVYCGPLRLLAWEVYENLNAAGVPCNLLTGQELMGVEGAQHTSCTVEMVDVNRTYDVGVVDECQLIGDRERGYAWTRAILGLPAVELHLCGSKAFLDLIQEQARQTGDSVEVREYERLSPLKTAQRPVKDWGADIRAGDCIVAFSRRKLFQLKNEIEVATGQRFRCCVVYDEHSGFDVLVASDAVGLGLNLNIRRLIFHSTSKFDGKVDRSLEPAEIKQIAGRAGRFRSRFEEGVVSARSRGDLALIAQALKSEDQPVEAAGVAPTREQLQLFARANGLRLRETAEDFQLARRRAPRGRGVAAPLGVAPDGRTYIEFARLLQLFQRAAKLGGADKRRLRGRGDEEEEEEEEDDLYFYTEMEDMIAIARLLEEIPMSLADRFVFCMAPVDTAKRELLSHLRFQAQQFSREGAVRLGLDVALEKMPETDRQLAYLEEKHAIIDFYLWLGQRFGADVYVEMIEATRAAELCSELIDAGLQVMRPKEAGNARGGRGRRGRAGPRSRLSRSRRH